jgi:hypothetical protein
VRIPFFQSGGGLVDLADLKPADIGWPALAMRLAHQSRWTGAADADGWPVTIAQHCVQGADAALRSPPAGISARELARHFLLHDAHEGFLGDITTPAAHLIAACAPAGTAGLVIHQAIHNAKRGLDRAIYAAAGLALPGRAMERAVKKLDRRMARAEALLLFGPASVGSAEIGVPAIVRAWGPALAAERWLDSFQRLIGNRA